MATVKVRLKYGSFSAQPDKAGPRERRQAGDVFDADPAYVAAHQEQFEVLGGVGAPGVPLVPGMAVPAGDAGAGHGAGGTAAAVEPAVGKRADPLQPKPKK